MNFTKFQNSTRACLCKWLTVNCYVSSWPVQPYDCSGQLAKCFQFNKFLANWNVCAPFTKFQNTARACHYNHSKYSAYLYKHIYVAHQYSQMTAIALVDRHCEFHKIPELNQSLVILQIVEREWSWYKSRRPVQPADWMSLTWCKWNFWFLHNLRKY